MIPDAAYCLQCQRRPGAKEPPFGYAICRRCRARLSKPMPEVNWFAVLAYAVIATIGLCWYTWPRS